MQEQILVLLTLDQLEYASKSVEHYLDVEDTDVGKMILDQVTGKLWDAEYMLKCSNFMKREGDEVDFTNRDQVVYWIDMMSAIIDGSERGRNKTSPKLKATCLELLPKLEEALKEIDGG